MMANQPIPLHADDVANPNQASADSAALSGYPAVMASLDKHLHVQEELCSALERVADALPDNVSNDECVILARRIYPIMHSAHKFEEGVLFPLLERAFAADPGLKTTLDRLHGEHWEDESYAEEISHALASFVREHAQERAETLGYMLRGFFEGVRRHIAFEREHLLPLVKQLEKAA